MPAYTNPVATKLTVPLPPGKRRKTKTTGQRKHFTASAHLRGIRARPPLELSQSRRSRVREKQR